MAGKSRYSSEIQAEAVAYSRKKGTAMTARKFKVSRATVSNWRKASTNETPKFVQPAVAEQQPEATTSLAEERAWAQLQKAIAEYVQLRETAAVDAFIASLQSAKTTSGE